MNFVYLTTFGAIKVRKKIWMYIYKELLTGMVYYTGIYTYIYLYVRMYYVYILCICVGWI